MSSKSLQLSHPFFNPHLTYMCLHSALDMQLLADKHILYKVQFSPKYTVAATLFLQRKQELSVYLLLGFRNDCKPTTCYVIIPWCRSAGSVSGFLHYTWTQCGTALCRHRPQTRFLLHTDLSTCLCFILFHLEFNQYVNFLQFALPQPLSPNWFICYGRGSTTAYLVVAVVTSSLSFWVRTLNSWLKSTGRNWIITGILSILRRPWSCSRLTMRWVEITKT